MASLVLSGDTSGSVTIAAPAVAGSTTQTLINVTGTLAPVVSGTVNAGGTNPFPSSAGPATVDFTNIPNWVKRITVMFSAVSTSGSSIPQIQLGDAGGVELTNYLAMVSNIQTTSNTTRGVTATSGFILVHAGGLSNVLNGAISFSLLASNTWVVSGNLYESNGNGLNSVSGAKALSDTLTTVRITTVNGTDLFDAGSINILYE
jgi:hypothetical protein